MTAQPTRSQVIGAFVVQAVTASAMTWNRYAQRVVEHYHATVEVMDRDTDFHVATTAENFAHCERLNTQTVRRVLSGEIRMPVDLEESLVAALDDRDREALQRQLLAREGLLFARRPAHGAGGEVVSACELMRTAADAVQRIAPMLTDGRITREDAPHFVAALDALHQVMGACMSVTEQIGLARGSAAPKARAARVAH